MSSSNFPHFSCFFLAARIRQRKRCFQEMPESTALSPVSPSSSHEGHSGGGGQHPFHPHNLPGVGSPEGSHVSLFLYYRDIPLERILWDFVISFTTNDIVDWMFGGPFLGFYGTVRIEIIDTEQNRNRIAI